MENDTEIITKITESEDTYHRLDRVALIAYYTRALSWVILGISVLTPVVQVVGQALAANGAALAPNWATIIPLFTRGIATGLYRLAVLQTLAQVLYLLLDIEYNTRTTSSTPEASDE
jgi:hypothetical protein